MNDLDCVKCQKSRQKGQDGNYENVNWIKTKMGIVIFSIKTQKTGRGLE